MMRFRKLALMVLAQGWVAGSAAQAATLTYIDGSTVKLEQLIGDVDKQKKAPTGNRTLSRYRIAGTDLGNSFEHDGRVFFLFGDTIGPGGGDAIAASRTADPEAGLSLDFLTDGKGGYLKVAPPRISMKGFEVPVAGISLGGRAYVAVKTNHAESEPTDMTVLTRFDEARRSFTPLRVLSRLPHGKVITMSMHEQVVPDESLPPGGPYVFIWSSGPHRSSSAYLSIVPSRQFEGGQGTRYFAGLDGDRRPLWSDQEAAARPVVDHPTIGDISVTWAPSVKLWLMTYDSRQPRGVIFRHAPTPWGPWSAQQIILAPQRDRVRDFIHQANSKDGLAGPVIGAGRADPEAVQGGFYAPYVIERFTRLAGDRLSIYFVLSTWNPYVVVLMRSSFSVDSAGQ